MVKRVVCFALGGHIASQNASFRTTAEILEPKDYEFYGAEDGFGAFDTGNVHRLKSGEIPRRFAGFVSGAGRFSLTDKEGSVNQNKLDKAVEFFKKGRFDIAIGSGGDDHGKQMAILNRVLEGKIGVYVINKTMDNDLGGKDGEKDSEGDEAPYTHFTNGFHTAVKVGANMIRKHYAGAWTNNLPYLIGIFGRETNWVGAALAYWGPADRIIYGELPEGHLGHSIEKIHELILESQKNNEKKYGRRFAMIIVPEGARISGLEHASELIDAHGHHKLNPEVLVTELKKELEKRYKLKTQTVGITYEMRNFTPTEKDVYNSECSGLVIAEAILGGENGLESVFKRRGNGGFVVGTAPIEKVSEKRYASYYPKPLIDKETFQVTDEIGNYYRPLFGNRKSLSSVLPRKPEVINIFQ